MDVFRKESDNPTGLNRRFLQPLKRQLESNEKRTRGHDHRTCAELATQIEVSHYEIFVRAYQWYHGCDFSTIDGDFKIYLLSGCDAVPYYVRQFSREWKPGLLSA